MGQKEPPRFGSTICYGQTWARKSHQDSAVRFVTAKSWPERATKTRQYDLLRPNVGQKEPPRLGSTICYGQELAGKSHRTICYGQTWARKSHQDSAVRFVTAKSWPEKATETRQCHLLRPRVWPKRATKTRQYDLLRPNVCQKKPPRLGSTVCYGQEMARKSHQDSAVRLVAAKSWTKRTTKTRQYDFTAKRGPERATKTRQYDLLRPRGGQKEPPRLDSTICYGQELARKSHQDSAVRFVMAKSCSSRPNVGQKEPPRLGSTICYGQELSRKSHQDSAVRFVTAKSWPEGATKTRQYDVLRPRLGHKEPPRLGSTICYGQTWATETRQYDLLRPRLGQKEPPRLGSTICYGQDLDRKSHQDSAVRFVTAKSWPEGATKTRQYDLLRPNVGQKEPPRLGSTMCYGQDLARKSHQDWEKATKTRQYDLLLPNVGQKEPPRLGSTICYGQELARKSHQDSAVRLVTAKRGPERATKTRQCYLLRPRVWPERATKTRQYDLLRPNVCQKKPPRLGNTICYGQELARKSHQDSAVRFVTAKRGPERATSAVRFVTAKSLARKSHRDSAVRFVTAKRGPERATKTRQYGLLRPRVGQKEPPRLGSTICYGQELARKSHQDSAVRFVLAKNWPERATKTRQYDLLRPNVGQKEPPRLGSTICYGQELSRKSHQDSAVRFVTAKRWPEKATETRQYDLLRPNVGQKEPPRLGSTICYGQTWARKSHRDSAVRFVTAKRGPERATKTRQYDLLRPNVGQKEPPRLGSTICYGQTWARKSHQDSAVRFVTAKRGPERATKTRQYDLLRPRVWPERATKTRQYDLLRPNMCQKKPPRLGNTICYGQELARKSHQDSAVRFVTAKSWPERATKTRQYDLLRPNVGQKEPPRLGSMICYGQELSRKSHQDSAVRFVTAKTWPERATKTRQYDLLRPRVGQKEPPRFGSTICYGQTWARKSHRAICYGQELARKSHQDSAVRFVTAKSWPERATKTRQYDLLRPRNGQKEPPRLGSTICYGQELARKGHQDSAVRFLTAKSWPERATKTRQYDLLRPRVGQKEPPRLGSTILRPNVGQIKPPRLGRAFCFGQELARKSHRDSAVRVVTAKRGPERAAKTRQYDLLRPRVGQKEPPRLGSTICYCQTWARLLRPRVGHKKPPRLGSTICYGQTWARKSHQDSAVRLVTAKRGPERAIKTRQYDLLRPNVGQKEPSRLGSTICYGQKKPPRLGSTTCYGQTWARKSHQDSAVRFVTAKSWPEKATETRQYDLLRPNVGQKEPPRLGSTICYGQELARKSHQDWAVRFVTAKRGPERATKTRQYGLLRPRVGQKEPPRLGSTICYGQELSRKSHQDSAVRFVTAKRGPERATKTRQYDLLRPRVGQKEPPRLGSTICFGQTWARKSHRAICYGQELARKSHQDSAVRFITAKSGPERATKTRQYDLLRPNVGQKEPPRLGSTICYGQQKEPPRLGSTILRPNVGQKEPKTRQYDLLRPRVGQKKPARLGSTIC